jgi:hypothetical protein
MCSLKSTSRLPSVGEYDFLEGLKKSAEDKDLLLEHAKGAHGSWPHVVSDCSAF